MEVLKLTLTGMAHGGAAFGRDESGRAIFVPFAIAGETVRVEIVEDKGRFATARLLEVVRPSPDRVQPQCPHYTTCGHSHYQHISYEAQLRFKAEILRDQLERIGRLTNVTVRPTLPNPEAWAYRADVTFFPAAGGGLGFWSPQQGQVTAVQSCPLLRPTLLEVLQDVDLELPGLRKLTLRLGDDGDVLAALEVEDVEPPELESESPISIAIVLPDGTAANLIGDNTIVRSLRGRDFRVSAGCYAYPSPAAAELVVDTVLRYADLENLTRRQGGHGEEDKEGSKVLELYSGVGMLTAFLSAGAAEVTAIEANPDAVADTAVNLADTENVALYEGWVEEILPGLDMAPDVVVVDPPEGGLPAGVIRALAAKRPGRLVYVSMDAAALARDGKELVAAGYQLQEVQPIDMFPQTYQIQSVSWWS
jgi:23S rRNA (uracil1939-C5)-methyltransferase